MLRSGCGGRNPEVRRGGASLPPATSALPNHPHPPYRRTPVSRGAGHAIHQPLSISPAPSRHSCHPLISFLRRQEPRGEAGRRRQLPNSDPDTDLLRRRRSLRYRLPMETATIHRNRHMLNARLVRLPMICLTPASLPGVGHAEGVFCTKIVASNLKCDTPPTNRMRNNLCCS